MSAGAGTESEAARLPTQHRPTRHRTRAVGSLLLASVLVVAGSSGAALGAKAGKDKGDDQQPAAAGPIAAVNGTTIRMAKARMAKRVTRLADETGDQRTTDGAPAAEAPGWSDITAVYVSPVRMPAKLLTKMAKDFPPGVPRAFYGAQARWQKGDRALFVAVEMAEALPADAEGQQVEVGIAGPAALPMQVGADLDARAGIERFSLSGVFSDGIFGTGTTDVRGRAVDDPIDYYNADAGVFGYYDPRGPRWFLVMPVTGDAEAARVTVRSSTPAGRVLDRLDLPGGGNFVALDDPAGGWEPDGPPPPLACRALETFSSASDIELTSPDATLIRYSAGLDPTTAADDAAAALAPAIEAAGAVPIVLSPVGSDAAPTTVDAELAVAPGGTAVSLTFEAPPGQWAFALPDEVELNTPAGEPIIDHRSLTGPAGVRTGPGLDGLVAGDAACATGGALPMATGDEDAGETSAPDSVEAAPGQASTDEGSADEGSAAGG